MLAETLIPPLRYELNFRQEPKHSRFCTCQPPLPLPSDCYSYVPFPAPIDRRPIDPPPIIELNIRGAEDNAWHALQNPNYIMFVSLTTPEIEGEDDEFRELHWLQVEESDGHRGPPTRYTTGSVVSSLHILKDPENGARQGGFFVFPDIGVRAEGRYRLKCTLYEIVESHTIYRNHTFSSVFEVFQSRKFPGMQKSTALSCSFSEQGIKIWIRKTVREKRDTPPFKKARIAVAENETRLSVSDSPLLFTMSRTSSPLPLFPPPPGYGQGRSRMSILSLLNS